jgi:hypothetical protein
MTIFLSSFFLLPTGADLLVKLGVVAFWVFRDSSEHEWDSNVNVELFTEHALFELRGVLYLLSRAGSLEVVDG